MNLHKVMAFFEDKIDPQLWPNTEINTLGNGDLEIFVYEFDNDQPYAKLFNLTIDGRSFETFTRLNTDPIMDRLASEKDWREILKFLQISMIRLRKNW